MPVQVRRAWLSLGLAFALLLAAILSEPAWGHAAHAPEESPAPTPGESPPASAPLQPTRLELVAPDRAELGKELVLRARLTRRDGKPIEGALIRFTARSFWGINYLEGEVTLGEARTDPSGVAVLATEPRSAGALTLKAAFPGSPSLAPSAAEVSVAVTGDAQLVTPSAGLRLPLVGVWMLQAVLALVWGLYSFAVSRIMTVARTGAALARPGALAKPSLPFPQRREFLGRLAAALGLQAGVAAMGSGLITVVARSPRTHSNLASASQLRGYRRTPLPRVRRGLPISPLPPVLQRKVTFKADVEPILRAKAGPHVFLPKNSPPPGGVRLDSYEEIMAKPGLVVPGKPEESTLVLALLDPAMRMPPSGPTLDDEEIRIIVSWVAQGAPRA